MPQRRCSFPSTPDETLAAESLSSGIDSGFLERNQPGMGPRGGLRKTSDRYGARMYGFEVGDGVTPLSGPMAGMYGTVVWFYEEKQQLLVRFGASQQMYYAAEELKRWGE